MKQLILNALKKYNYFIGLHQLCRYLNNKGYIRYGCNAKYTDDLNTIKKKTIKINPCKILCFNSNIYISKIFSILIKYKDFKNPYVNTEKHRTFDIFRFISLNKNIYLDFKRTNALIEL